MKDGLQELWRLSLRKGSSTGRHLVEDRARRVDVASGIGRLATQLFRGHVRERARDGHWLRAQGRGTPSGGSCYSSQPEVEDLQPTVWGDPQVAGLEVRVH